MQARGGIKCSNGNKLANHSQGVDLCGQGMGHTYSAEVGIYGYNLYNNFKSWWIGKTKMN